MRTAISTAAAAIGLALSAWLALLKILALPCVGGGCEAVIQSSYGSFLGVPVGIYGVALWLGAFFARNERRRHACLWILAMGAVVFVCIQAFILRAFCPYCMAHAFAAWIALLFRAQRPRRWGAAAAVLLAAAAAAAIATAASREGQGRQTPLAAFASRQPEAFRWLGPKGPASPAVVFSLTCPACLDKLAGLEKLDLSKQTNAAGIYLKVGERDKALTTAFVGAVLAQPGERSDAFLAVAAYCLSQRDLVLSDPDAAAKVLRGVFPGAAARMDEAGALLARQSAELGKAAVNTTPLLIGADGTARAFFPVDDLFPPGR